MVLEECGGDMVAKPIVQKLSANGLVYVLREIFGIEPKVPAVDGAEAEDDGEDG